MTPATFTDRSWQSFLRQCGLTLIILLGLSTSGCGKVYYRDEAREAAPQTSRHGSLRVYMWEGYLAPSVIKDYEKEFGITLHLTYFKTNHQLLSVLNQGAQYDLIMPSAFLAEHLIAQNRLAKLDASRIPNLRYLAPRFKREKYDPGLVYTVPYFCGALGIAYNSKVLSIPFHWSDLFNPQDEDLTNKITIDDEPRDSLGAALISLGFSPNTTNFAEIRQAGKVLENFKPYIYKLDSVEVHNDLVNGNILMAMAWSGEAQLAMKKDLAIRFSIPEEGTITYLDVFAIPKTSRKKSIAEGFLNFLLRPSVQARNINFSGYAGTSEGALAFVDPAIFNGPAYMAPPPEKDFHLRDVSPAAIAAYVDVWNAIFPGGALPAANLGPHLTPAKPGTH